MAKWILIFLGGIALGGAFAFFLLMGEGEAPPTPAPAPEKPSWMASKPPAPEKQEERERDPLIGVIGPETGEEARYGLAVLEGIRMAAERFNGQGGVGGERIEVIHLDNSGGPGQAHEMAAELIRRNVVAIFSAPTGSSTFAPTQQVNRSKTIFISVGTRRKIGRSGDYVFRFSLPDATAIGDMLKFAIGELGYRDFALVTSSSYDYSLSVSSVFKQAISRGDGQILTEADTYDTYSGKTNIEGVVSALKSAPKPSQALIFTGGAGEAVLLARAVKEAGLNLPLIGGEDLFSEEFLEQGGEAINGALLYATFSPHSDSPPVVQFVRDYAARKNAVPDRFAALAYDAFTLLGKALKEAGSLKGSEVHGALLNIKKSDGVTGPSGWSPEGTPIKHPFLYRVESGPAGGKFVLQQTQGDRKNEN